MGSLQLVTELGESVFPAGDQNEITASRGKLMSELRPNPGGSSRNDCPLVAQIFHGVLPVLSVFVPVVMGMVVAVRLLDLTASELPEGLDVLLVIHPKELPDPLLYAIDQYALGGGPVLAFVDPFCETDETGIDPQNPMSRFQADRSSGLKKLFDVWGLQLDAGSFVGDRERAMRFGVRSENGILQLPIVYLLQLGEEDVNAEDPVTSLLTNLQVAAAGSLRPMAEATTTFTPLIQTTEEATLLDTGKLSFQPDYEGLLADYTPGFESLTLAARVTGPVSTAFPAGPPPPAVPDPNGEEPPPAPGPGLTEGDLQVVVVADVDMLTDRWWVQEQRISQTMALRSIISENATLAVNAVENLSVGEELISIRARGQYSRPFDRVEDLRLEAEQEYLATAKELESRLQRIETRLRELDSETGEGADELVTQAQRDAIEEALDEKVQTRKELREVRRKLDQDIERLGTNIKFANLLVVPRGVMLFGLLVGLVRYGRRR